MRHSQYRQNLIGQKCVQALECRMSQDESFIFSLKEKQYILNVIEHLSAEFLWCFLHCLHWSDHHCGFLANLAC